MQELIILGGGGFAREVHWLVQEINAVKPTFVVLGFACNDVHGKLPGEWLGTDSFIQEIFSRKSEKPHIIAAIGDGKLRMKLLQEYSAQGFGIASLVHPTAKVGPGSKIGVGAILCAGAIITVNVNGGKSIVVNLNSTIGHDCRLHDGVTISPGCHLSGGTFCDDFVSLGTGAVTLPNININMGTQVGAGAVVTRNLPSYVVATGVPAKETRNLQP